MRALSQSKLLEGEEGSFTLFRNCSIRKEESFDENNY